MPMPARLTFARPVGPSGCACASGGRRKRSPAWRLGRAVAMTCLALAAAGGRSAPVPEAARAFSITRMDPAMDALIAPDAKLITVASGFGFSDGPVWIRAKNGAPGYLLVSSIIGNVIYKVTPSGQVTVLRDDAGYSGDDFAHDGKLSYIGRLHIILIGPNCTGVDPAGRLVWCAGQDRVIKRVEQDGTAGVLIDRGEGKRFNGPNDVAIAADGAIYFTDSDVGLRGGIKGGLAEMPNAVWRWKDGRTTKVVTSSELGSEPNGIALSPDDKYLYLSAGIAPPQSRIMRYPIKADGSVGPGVPFTQGDGIGDGMKTDRLGNLYSTGPLTATVRITSPDGKLLGMINLPKPGAAEPRRLICASALAFGGDDAKTLYITACDDVYALPLRSPGILEGPPR